MSCAKCYRVFVSLCIVCTIFAVAGAVFHCGEWSPWYNSSTPAMYNGSKEIEEVPDEVLRICKNGRTVSCKDDKSEPFKETYNRTSGDKKFIYSCSPDFGVTCFTINQNATCQDYAIRFYCDCPSTPDFTTITMAYSDMTSPVQNLPTESPGTSTSYPGIRNRTSWQNSTGTNGNAGIGINPNRNTGNSSINSEIVLLLLPILTWLLQFHFW